MKNLIRLISLRYARATPGRTFLTLFGIILGVSVVFAIDVVNSSVKGSFENTIDNVSGKTALTVESPSGVAEELLETVKAVEGVGTAVPVIEESAYEEKSGIQLAVLAVDTLSDGNVRDYEVTANDVKIADDLAFLNDPHSVLVTTRFAQDHGIKDGDTLNLSTVSGKSAYTVRGTLAARGPAKVFGGDLLLMDVYAAQIAFGRGKRFDRIDLVPTPGADVAALQKRLEAAVNGKANVSRPERRSEETEHLLAGFKLGLSLASMVAMFVGGFIVYNALAIAVAQRRREIGILRALGTTRMQILLLFVGEGLILGALGAVLGLGFGLVLARTVLKAVGGTISALYVTIEPDKLIITPSDMIIASSLGVAVAVIAAFFPARRAAVVDPASVMRKKNDADASPSSVTTSLKAGCAMLLLALTMGAIAHIRENVTLGYAVGGVCAFAAAFFAPALSMLVGNTARRLLGARNPAIMLGSVSFIRNAGRNSIAIAALGMSLANAVNADAFVGSMKHNTQRWFERSARADLFVVAGQNVKYKVDHPLPESIGQEIERLPGVEFVDYGRTRQHSFRGRPFHLTVGVLERYSQYNDIPVVAGDLNVALKAIQAGTGLAASENFANNFHIKLGDHITLQTPTGDQTFEIVLIQVDFSSELGTLFTTRSVYKRIWEDSLVDAFYVYLRKGVDSSVTRDQIVADLGKRYRLLALSNGQYKEELMSLIDGSFTISRATEIVAIIVAILGIINTLLVTVMDRRTEIGVLQAIGARRRQIEHMLMTEGALIGLAASVLGAAFGAVFSAYVVKELLRFQVGWQMTWQLSGWVLLETFIVAQVVAFVSVWWPMRSAGKVDAIEALQSE